MISPVKGLKGLKKRHKATVYIIQKSGEKQVYYQDLFCHRWVAMAFCLIMCININDLVQQGLFDIEVEIKPLS
jgi:hypothetical protein